MELYRKLIDSHPEIELKGSKKLPHTSHNGHMFTMLTKAGYVGLRMGKAEREAFVEKYDTQLLENYGTVMKEYVQVPDSLLENIEDFKPYLEQSYAYIQTLKPKPDKKKSK